MYALVDGNSFYARCEVVFRPDLEKTPIVVLSNNDGALVAANAEAKALGIEMFKPYFKIKNLLQKHDVKVFSSNYELYGDLSCRMHEIVGGFAFEQEIYSIDESFLNFKGMTNWNLTEHGHLIKKTVLKNIGIPVAVGIGLTKTLAKVANNRAKKIAHFNYVLSISEMPEKEQDILLKEMSVSDVWGVGRKHTLKLNSLGITNALQLKQSSPKRIKSLFSVVLERTVHELNGISCQDLELIPPKKQEIVSSRSFSRSVTSYAEMVNVVSRYISLAAEKLRKQGSCCKQISVGINTNPFKVEAKQYRNWQSIMLVQPSNHTGHLIERAKHCLAEIWKNGYEYKKATVMLSDISQQEHVQLDMFATQPKYSNNEKSKAMMDVLDAINKKMGQHSCRMGSEGIDKLATWTMKRNMMSPRYTTSWGELPIAYTK